MIEQEWLVSQCPVAMLACIMHQPERVPPSRPLVNVSPRKLRLFAVHCWRMSSRGEIGFNEALIQLEEVAEGTRNQFSNLAEPYICANLDTSVMLRWLSQDLWGVGDPMGPPTNEDVKRQKYGANLLREIVGNPFRTVSIPWPYWSQVPGIFKVREIAQRIYDTRDWPALPILADALEDAGCGATSNQLDTGHELLAHLRSPGPHVRGCWATDLVLGKE